MKMDRALFALQRLTALILAPLVLIHLGLIIYAVRGGLTADDILGRTEGNWWWIGFYGVFVMAAAIHGPIGVRNVLIEWGRLNRRTASQLSVGLAALLAALGLRAVAGVGGLI
ncbi:MAG: succinate dehydrogenase [Ectothiorhodospiraceae bacterium]|nr:succinate dehydrogenase [Ectothiorhodospiraceae bacterium]